MLLTYKIPIKPTKAQARILWALSEKCRLLYNFALAERLYHWKTNLQNQESREKSNKN
ncbi:MAG: helix-turn-helix domain-containing protein [Promethearchaeota archaeon]